MAALIFSIGMLRRSLTVTLAVSIRTAMSRLNLHGRLFNFQGVVVVIHDWIGGAFLSVQLISTLI